MNKKLIVVGLSVLMSVTACGETSGNNSEQTSEQSIISLNSEEKQIANELQTFICDQLKNDNETTYNAYYATAEQAITGYCESAAAKGVKVGTITSFVLDFSTLAGAMESGIMGITVAAPAILMKYSLPTGTELEQGVRYLLTYAKSYLTLVACDTTYTEVEVKAATDLVNLINTEEESTVSNAVSIARGVIKTLADVLASPIISVNIPAFLNDDQTINADSLKSIATTISNIGKTDIVPTEAAVSYFADLSTKVLNVMKDMEPVIATIKSVVDAIGFVDFVGGVYDTLEKLFTTLGDLPEEYYEHLEEITNPFESYIYAVTGFGYELVKDVWFESEDAAESAKEISEFVDEIFPLISSLLPVEVASYEGLEGALTVIFKFVGEMWNYGITSFDAAEFSYAIGELVNLVLVSADPTTIDMEKVQDVIDYLLAPIVALTDHVVLTSVFEFVVGLADAATKLAYTDGNGTKYLLTDLIPTQYRQTALAIANTIIASATTNEREWSMVISSICKLLSDVASYFVRNGEEFPEADLVMFVMLLINSDDPLSVITGLFPYTWLEDVESLAEHVAILLDALEYDETFYGMLNQTFGLTGEMMITDQLTFKGFVHAFLIGYIDPTTIPAE